MFLCIGTTPTAQQTMLFDRVVQDEVNRAKRVLSTASGKSVNVARTLHTLGEAVMAVVPVGGATGKTLQADIEAVGISADFVSVKSPTRTCVTVIDQSAGTVTELVEEHGPLTVEEYERILAVAESHVYSAAAKMMILSGSLAAGVSDDFYADCCRAAARENVPVIVDARGEPLRKTLVWKPLAVKPNRMELAATTGMEIKDEAALKLAMTKLHGLGAQWVIVTLGRDGAVATDGKTFWKIPAVPIEAISPIGSGDAFAAGLAAGVGRGSEVPEACRLAAACAAANTLVLGSGISRLDDIVRLHKQARVERL